MKNPSSNEISVCASDIVIYPGTYVVAPTRFGLDMGIVIGNVPDRNSSYNPGCTGVRGACCLDSCPMEEPEDDESEDDDLVAAADYEGALEPLSFKVTSVTSIDPLPKKETCDDSGCWESRYQKPVKAMLSGSLDRIDRVATPDDMKKYYQNLENEEEAMKVCREKIGKHNLDMKLVTSHFLLGEPKALFFFTSDDRVDFRDLVKDLVSVFRLRIELRQIGVRDESRVLGGLAVCGRDFCCHSVTDKLSPVTIKMAKEQNLSLNSMKISGPCGRLLCCLAYEYDFYMEEKHDYPYEGSKLKVGGEICKVTEVNILSKKITLSSIDGRIIIIPRSAVFYSGDSSRWEITPEYEKDFFSN
ncbi:MAG: regulatory iron-sulfur-containing complex subunit RicT [Sphaerochaetaceae bacterium]|nr:regulatory iron-sulfur-containing complex subunit RicT [Sphaerochaetaceae bacterium]MDD4006479.1 regulatory iron-sulfur-containing complex subunit RicT [Sphaerochaetaceae bacterium]MDD4396532.1 regulatory iron-sulfur-containing complex subunit RicT [Sphaerochaetaceae bacterium]